MAQALEGMLEVVAHGPGAVEPGGEEDGGYGPGTRVTKESKDMGNTSRHTSGSQEDLDAMAGDVTHGPTDAVHR